MKFHKQRYRHKPEEGQFGDCHRTALACILDLEPEDVPNFGEAFNDTERFVQWERDWLKSKGLARFGCCMNGSCTVEEALLATKGVNSDVYCIFAGKSRNGVNHSVIALNGEIIHDPAIDNSGIVGPCEEGYYFIDVLVPLAVTRIAA